MGSAQKWAVCNDGITQFNKLPTHEPYLPLSPQPQGITAFWLVLRLPTKGWPG